MTPNSRRFVWGSARRCPGWDGRQPGHLLVSGRESDDPTHEHDPVRTCLVPGGGLSMHDRVAEFSRPTFGCATRRRDGSSSGVRVIGRGATAYAPGPPDQWELQRQACECEREVGRGARSVVDGHLHVRREDEDEENRGERRRRAPGRRARDPDCEPELNDPAQRGPEPARPGKQARNDGVESVGRDEVRDAGQREQPGQPQRPRIAGPGVGRSLLGRDAVHEVIVPHPAARGRRGVPRARSAASEFLPTVGTENGATRRPSPRLLGAKPVARGRKCS